MLRLLAGATVLCVLSGLAIAADTPMPTPSIVDARYNTLGVRTGMTPMQIEEALKKADVGGSPVKRNSTDYLTGESYTYNMELRVKKLNPADPSHADIADLLSVYFSPMASGNRSILVHRQTVFRRDSRPTLSVMEGSLEEKYGKPTNAHTPFKVNDTQANGQYLFSTEGKLDQDQELYMSGNCNKDSQFEALSFIKKCGGVTLAWHLDNSSPDSDLVSNFDVLIKDQAFAIASDKYVRALVIAAQVNRKSETVQTTQTHDQDLPKGAAEPKL